MTERPLPDPLAWASAIASRWDEIRLGNARNEFKKPAPWPQAEPEGPFAVYLSDKGTYRTLAFDFDKKSPSVESDADDAFHLLEVVGFAPVLVESGGGGFHVFAHLSGSISAQSVHPIVQTLMKTWRSLDASPMLNPDYGCIRPPGALHRSGTRSLVVRGSLSDFLNHQQDYAFNSLVRTIAIVPTPENLANDMHPQEVPEPKADRIHVLLSEGDTQRDYWTRSESIQAIVLGLVVAGLTVDEVFGALMNPKNVGGRKIQGMTPATARRYVEHSYQKATSYLARQAEDRSREMAEIRRFAAFTETIEWKGTSGATDHTVMQCLIHTALVRGSRTLGMAARTLAENAGIRRVTASKSLSRLEDRGLIERVLRAQGGKAARWRLVLQSDASQTHQGGCVKTGSIPQPYLPEAFFWRGGLGHNAQRIYIYLKETGPSSIVSIAKLLRIDATTVSRKLKDLEAHGLTRFDASVRLWSSVDGNLDLIAEELGVAGRRAAQIDLHKAERVGHRDRETMTDQSGHGIVLTLREVGRQRERPKER